MEPSSQESDDSSTSERPSPKVRSVILRPSNVEPRSITVDSDTRGGDEPTTRKRNEQDTTSLADVVDPKDEVSGLEDKTPRPERGRSYQKVHRKPSFRHCVHASRSSSSSDEQSRDRRRPNSRRRRGRKHYCKSKKGARKHGHDHDYHRNIKPDKYDGTQCVETFMVKFDNCAKYNNWKDVDKAAHLRASLTGPAGLYYGNLRIYPMASWQRSCVAVTVPGSNKRSFVLSYDIANESKTKQYRS